MHTDLTFKVSQLRAKNQNIMLTAVTVIVAALFTAALLPSLLVQYVYADQQLFAQPLLLQYIPVVAFGVGMGYFIFAVIGNLMRAKRASYLEKEINLKGCCCCCNDEEVVSELENLAESLVNEKKTPAKKKSAPKSKTKK